MGSLSRVCVHYCELEEWLREQKSAYPTLPVYGTLLNGRNIYEPDAMSKEEGGIIIMGNEGNGISNPPAAYSRLSAYKAERAPRIT